MKTQIARNIEVKYTLKSFDEEKERETFSKYMMAPDSDEMWNDYRSFNRGDRTTVQQIVNLAYWHLLGKQDANIDAHLVPNIPFKFDLKTKEAVVALQDGYSLKVWIDVDTSK